MSVYMYVCVYVYVYVYVFVNYLIITTHTMTHHPLHNHCVVLFSLSPSLFLSLSLFFSFFLSFALIPSVSVYCRNIEARRLPPTPTNHTKITQNIDEVLTTLQFTTVQYTPNTKTVTYSYWIKRRDTKTHKQRITPGIIVYRARNKQTGRFILSLDEMEKNYNMGRRMNEVMIDGKSVDLSVCHCHLLCTEF